MTTLTRVEGTAFYEEDGATADPGFLAYVVAPQEITPHELPSTLTVSEAWHAAAGLQGYLLFLRERPNWDVFAPIFQQHSGLPSPPHTGFAWVTYSNETERLGPLYRLDAVEAPGHVAIAASVTFWFQNYGLPFKEGGPITATADPMGAIDKFTFEYPVAEHWPRPEGMGINLSLTGSTRFCLSSLGLLGDLSDDREHGWDVALRFFADSGGSLIGQRYPVFRPADPGYQLLVEINWDPLDHLNPHRTWLGLTGHTYRLRDLDGIPSFEPEPHQGVIPSWFRTIYGAPIGLRPVRASAHPARLVFQRRPAPDDRECLYYLVPSGEFECVMDEDREAELDSQHLLCGLAGTESVGLYPGAGTAPGSIMRFHPGHSAFAPVFPRLPIAAPPSEPRGPQAETPLLGDEWTTSWVSFAPNPAAPTQVPIYFSQPEEASLFEPTSDGAGTHFLLDNFFAPAARLDATSDVRVLPLVPYSGLALGTGQQTFSAADVRDFEFQILSPARRVAVAPAILARDRSTPSGGLRREVTTATTRQGFVAKMQGLDWLSVILAENDEDGSRLEFTDLPPPLRACFQSNQLLLVASLKEPLGAFANRITIGGWPFHLDVGHAPEDSDYGNVLIFKFRPGTVKQLVADPVSWTDGRHFNEDPTTLSRWLASYIEQAELSMGDTPQLGSFVDLVNDPSWNGILALNVTVGLLQFPQDLKGLLGGIDLRRFSAHHLGVQVNFLTGDGGLRPQKSSLFALINYVDRDRDTRLTTRSYYANERGLMQYNPPIHVSQAKRGESMDFTVLSLQVAFENSDITAFISNVILTTSHWFGEPASLVPSFPPNPLEEHSIEFFGSYENHNGQRIYSFITPESRQYKFMLTSSVLNYVGIVKGSFSTLRSMGDEGGASVAKIRSRFSFLGYLNFRVLDELDVLSFGNPSDTVANTASGLNFSDIGISMEFEIAEGSASDPIFVFDPKSAAFDVSLSVVRPSSLFRCFPLRAPALVQGPDADAIATLGFLPVRTPVPTSPIRARWYGLVYALDLGTRGALAERAGFTASLLVAWCPGAPRPDASVYIRLPGGGTGKATLSVQSALQLTTEFFALTRASDPNSEQPAYTLLFKSIALSLLGKRLPPNGDTDLVLLGRAGPDEDAKSLGWFAAFYRKDPSWQR